jgi:outer membrane protein assembly factor BamB
MIGSSCGIGKNAIVAGTADGDVFAVSRKDGKQFWETKLLNIDTPPMYSFKDLFLVADSEKGVYAIDANSGKIKWEYNSECGEYMNLQGNKAFFGNGNRGFTCINLENGKEIWTKDIDDGNPFVNGNKYFCASGFSSTPVIIGDVIYGGDYTHTVAAMNKNTGEVLWVDYFPKLNRTGINAYKNGLILSSEEAITLVNLKGGIVAKYKLPASMVNKESANEIAVDGDYLILTNEKGKVARVTLKNF